MHACHIATLADLRHIENGVDRKPPYCQYSAMNTKVPNAEQVMDALARGGTVAKAAALLGLSERTLYRRMEGFGIKVRRVPVQDAA